MVGPIPLTPTPCGGSFFTQPLVFAAAAENLRADLDLGGKVEDHGIRATDRDTIAWLGAEFQQPVFDTNPVQSVGKVTNSLGVGEVGLLYPPLRLLAANPPELGLTLDTELGRNISGFGRMTIRFGGGGGAESRRALTSRPIAKINSRNPRRFWLRSGKHAALDRESPRRPSRPPPGVRDVDLVQSDEPRPVFQLAMRLQFGLDHLEIGQRVAACS